MKLNSTNPEALEKETEIRYKKRDKRKKLAMRVSGSSAKKLIRLIKQVNSD